MSLSCHHHRNRRRRLWNRHRISSQLEHFLLLLLFRFRTRHQFRARLLFRLQFLVLVLHPSDRTFPLDRLHLQSLVPRLLDRELFLMQAEPIIAELQVVLFQHLHRQRPHPRRQPLIPRPPQLRVLLHHLAFRPMPLDLLMTHPRPLPAMADLMVVHLLHRLPTTAVMTAPILTTMVPPTIRVMMTLTEMAVLPTIQDPSIRIPSGVTSFLVVIGKCTASILVVCICIWFVVANTTCIHYSRGHILVPKLGLNTTLLLA